MTALRSISCAEATERAAFFVLGALDTREALEVREHLETCSRAHEEFAEIGGVVPHLADLPDDVEPAPELRQRLLDAVDADVRARRREYDAAERLVASFGAQPRPAPTARPLAPADRETDEPSAIAVGPGLPSPPTVSREPGLAETPTPSQPPLAADTAPPISAAKTEPQAPAPGVSRPTGTAPMESSAAMESSPTIGSWPAIDASASTIESTVPAVEMPARVLERRREESRRRPVMAWLVAAAAIIAVVALGGWNLLLQAQLAEQRDRAQALQGALASRNEPGALVAVLAGTDSAPGASGTAVMPIGRVGYLVVQGLAPAPAGKTYQAWYISGKETQSAGVFKVGADGMAILSGLRAPGSVDAMAVTLEQEGGVEKPSQKPLVYGKVGG